MMIMIMLLTWATIHTVMTAISTLTNVDSIWTYSTGLHFHVVGEGVVRLRSQRQERVYDRENYIDFRMRLLGEPGELYNKQSRNLKTHNTVSYIGRYDCARRRIAKPQPTSQVQIETNLLYQELFKGERDFTNQTQSTRYNCRVWVI